VLRVVTDTLLSTGRGDGSRAGVAFSSVFVSIYSLEHFITPQRIFVLHWITLVSFFINIKIYKTFIKVPSFTTSIHSTNSSRGPIELKFS
jgi:hypothetical protein